VPSGCACVHEAVCVIRSLPSSNQSFLKGSDMQLNDPVHQEPVPTADGDSSPAPDDRFRSAPCSRPVMSFLRRGLAEHECRRKAFRTSPLRVCLDSEERWQCDPRTGAPEPFHVPLSASYLEVFGDDEGGAILVAVFPLPAPEGVDGEGIQYMSVTLGGGRRWRSRLRWAMGLMARGTSM
jgi:hypothetical protein